ncbi:c-type cytochrome [Pseudoduganella sp. UC29_106]|uniref:c-type cytochrome n=1 Tax=Pseudoduganella sp. UC29_106 TaxID=3374553 RepID=UPI003757BCB7
MKRTATILLALCATTASAADAIKPGARLASTCAGCHGTNGATQGTSLPPLAGQPKDALLTKLKNFKTGATQSTIMTQIAKGYTDEQLETLAAYFSNQKK